MAGTLGFEQIVHAVQDPLRRFADRVQTLAVSNCPLPLGQLAECVVARPGPFWTARPGHGPHR